MRRDRDTRLRLVLIDDYALMRELVREAIDAEPDMSVVGDVAGNASGIKLCHIEQPDVVLLAANIASESTAATVNSIRALSPDARILILSLVDDPTLMRQLLDCGVRGYLTKSVGRTDLASSIRAVCADDSRVVLHVSAKALNHIVSSENYLETLTKREMEILALVYQAMSNRQISRRLTIAEGTVKRHLGTIFTKLGARTRLDAVNKAIANGLIVPTD